MLIHPDRHVACRVQDQEFAIIKSVDKNIVEVVSAIYRATGLTLKDAKQLIDLVRKGFYQKLPLDRLSADDKCSLLSQLRNYNVKFTLQ